MMGQHSEGSLLKLLGIIAAIVVGILLFVYVGIPLLAFILHVIWGLSGLIAFLMKLLIFVVVCVAAILGLIMLFSWIIREFTE
jgi:hypothetical protein